MRIKELSPGTKAWYATKKKDLLNGNGDLVTIVELTKRLVATHQPCGVIITRAAKDIAFETQVLIKFDQESRYLQRLESADAPPTYKLLNSGGRYLMSDTEHAVHRAARDARRLERDAHHQRGKQLATDVEDRVKKRLAEVGVPAELVVVHLNRHWDRDPFISMVTTTLDDKAVRNMLKNDTTLTQLLKDRDAWQKAPVPGQDCIL